MNFLREVQLEFHFCTILALMDPDPSSEVRALLDLENAFRYLKHVFWNVHWQAKFLPTNFAMRGSLDNHPYRRRPRKCRQRESDI